jgi:hypothetical protein
MARFTVYAAQEGRHLSHIVEGESFEDAALAFTQMWGPAADHDAMAEGEGGGVRLRVVDRDSGDQQCFIVDLGSPDPVTCA